MNGRLLRWLDWWPDDDVPVPLNFTDPIAVLDGIEALVARIDRNSH